MWIRKSKLEKLYDTISHLTVTAFSDHQSIKIIDKDLAKDRIDIIELQEEINKLKSNNEN